MQTSRQDRSRVTTSYGRDPAWRCLRAELRGCAQASRSPTVRGDAAMTTAKVDRRRCQPAAPAGVTEAAHPRPSLRPYPCVAKQHANRCRRENFVQPLPLRSPHRLSACLSTCLSVSSVGQKKMELEPTSLAWHVHFVTTSLAAWRGTGRRTLCTSLRAVIGAWAAPGPGDARTALCCAEPSESDTACRVRG